MNLISVWGTEANPFANPEKANNGGGYSQPCGGAVYATESGELISILVSDTSCGAFGTRYSVEIDNGQRKWAHHWGSMDGEITFTQSLDRLVQGIGRVCGFCAWELIRDTAGAIRTVVNAA